MSFVLSMIAKLKAILLLLLTLIELQLSGPLSLYSPLQIARPPSGRTILHCTLSVFSIVVLEFVLPLSPNVSLPASPH